MQLMGKTIMSWNHTHMDKSSNRYEHTQACGDTRTHFVSQQKSA